VYLKTPDSSTEPPVVDKSIFPLKNPELLYLTPS